MKRIAALFVFTLISAVLFGQIVKYINLAEEPTKITQPIESGKEIIIKILNRSKVNSYEIIINRISPDIPPLESQGTPNAIKGNAAANDCDRLEDAYNSILTEPSESKLPALRKKLNDLIRGNLTSCIKLRDQAIKLEREMDLNYNIEPLKKGEVLEIIIKRITPTSKEWKATYNTGNKGVWKTSYGFAFIPTSFSKEKKFFLDSVNKIKPENNSKNLDYAPGIFFNWFPAKRALNDFSWGFSGGLGINFSTDPVVFLGGSTTYQHNISINFGLVAYRQSFLKGRYHEGEVINENNFDEENGLHQKLFRINPFIAVSFRFGQNPFTPAED